MNKKTLREVFEFFPDLTHIVQDQYGLRGYKLPAKPEINVSLKGWFQYIGTGLRYHKGYTFNPSILTVDWGKLRTWKKRCVSREEIIKEEKPKRANLFPQSEQTKGCA